MPWEKPAFQAVNMSSEIGAYQDELDEQRSGGVTREPLPDSSVKPHTQTSPES